MKTQNQKIKIEKKKGLKQQILLIDYNNSTFAKIYNDYDFEVVFEKSSQVQGKQKAGGQSAARFGRKRQEAIKSWFKKIAEMLDETEGNFVVGCSSVYYERFYNYLPERTQDRVIERISTEYADLSGVYQFINILRNE